ncbi:MAG: hypothetical protein HY854_12955 [Burkholderiales bacterium]|nr:hypothetical protein [Burkholderiales bacterium]
MQAVLLPLELGLSLEQTAALVGRSSSWVATQRRRYIDGSLDPTAPRMRGGRRNALLSEEDEVAIVKRGIMLSAYSPTPARVKIRELLEERVGDVIPDSTLYAIISRVAKKFVPDGKGSDITRLSHALTEKWLRERVEVQKKMGKKFSV